MYQWDKKGDEKEATWINSTTLFQRGAKPLELTHFTERSCSVLPPWKASSWVGRCSADSDPEAWHCHWSPL